MISSRVCLGFPISLSLYCRLYVPIFSLARGFRLSYILSASQAGDSPIYKSLSQRTDMRTRATAFLFFPSLSLPIFLCPPYGNSPRPISFASWDSLASSRLTEKFLLFHERFFRIFLFRFIKPSSLRNFMQRIFAARVNSIRPLVSLFLFFSSPPTLLVIFTVISFASDQRRIYFSCTTLTRHYFILFYSLQLIRPVGYSMYGFS